MYPNASGTFRRYLISFARHSSRAYCTKGQGSEQDERYRTCAKYMADWIGRARAPPLQSLPTCPVDGEPFLDLSEYILPSQLQPTTQVEEARGPRSASSFAAGSSLSPFGSTSLGTSAPQDIQIPELPVADAWGSHSDLSTPGSGSSSQYAIAPAQASIYEASDELPFPYSGEHFVML